MYGGSSYHKYVHIKNFLINVGGVNTARSKYSGRAAESRMSSPEMVLGRGGTTTLHARSDLHVVTARNGTAPFTFHIFWLILILIIIIIIIIIILGISFMLRQTMSLRNTVLQLF